MSTEATAAAVPPGLEAGDFCEAFAMAVAACAGAAALRHADGTVELTWKQFDERVRGVAGGLAALGVGRDGTVAMLLSNRHEAALTDMATLHLGAVPVSFYNSSSVEQLAYLLDDSRADVIVTERLLVDRAIAARAQATRPVKLVVVDGDVASDGAANGSAATASSVAAATLDALIALGTPLPPGTRPELSPADLVTVVYTSGTTGEPKGAELTHDNILAQIRGLHSLGRLPNGGRALSYLPFAHMGDRLCAYYMPVVMGACITYHGDPRTAANLLPEIQPTLYMAVPRIWERIGDSARAWIAQQSPARADALGDAVRLGSELHDDRVEDRHHDGATAARWQARRPLLHELRTALGLANGDLLFTGAAPLPPETLRFFAAIGVDLCECYGQSETAGIILCNPAERPRPITNGLPLPGVEAKIEDDGELLLKGPMVMRGYRGKPELTAAAIDADGWLRTGDVFVTDEAGYYRIVDRKKEIIVSSSGKNIAPAFVENAITSVSPLVATAVCIGDARSYITAMIVLEPIGASTLSGTADPVETAGNEQVVAAIKEAIRTANTALNGAEQVRRFRIVERTWMPGTEELTPTMKLKRKPIAAKYAREIDELYTPGAPGVIDVDER